MPLHLLDKKSWNVYNRENIDRVKRDEAAAAAQEAAEEQRMQEVDAERRIHLLRGIKPEVIPTTSTPTEQVAERDEAPHKRERKRRRRAGEDDTDRDIRLAREDQAVVPVKAELQVKSSKTSDAPLMDRRGHIDLFPMDGSRHSAPKNAEVEAEKAKKKKEFEDQYTMRFSNAAGFKQSIGEKPWYHSSGIIQDKTLEVPSKDVWGNEDPRRKEREKLKVAADDPMAMMQRGVSQLRQVEKERKEWREERDRETRDLDSLRIRRRQRSHRKHEEEELEMLDESPHYRAVDVNASLKHAIHEPIHAGDYLRL
ncbi:MAG: hypothetical protein LQ343_002877 [Gyalolechia ehrenbergii]|nr:MAG: hypothetical protein LQ343_002877 [Gyalolechia ehrenbergii]